MSPKSYRLIFASHSSIGSPSGFGKDKLGLYVRKSITSTKIFPVTQAAVAMVHGEIIDYESMGR